MKIHTLLILITASVALGDTPPPGTVKAKLFSGDGVTGFTATGTALDVSVVNSVLNTSVQSSALPANACQESGGNLATIVSELSSPLAVTGTFWQSVQPVSGTFWQTTQPVSGTVTANAGSGTFTVDGSGHTQPVSGTFWQSTQPVSLASLPSGSNTIGAVNINGTVPVSGTITTTNSANGNPGASAPSQATQVGGVDNSGKLQPIEVSSSGVVSVDASGSTVPVSGTFFQATQPVSGTFWQATQPVSASSLPLPTGAATESTVSSIDTKTPALGQALAAGSVPVVLPLSQISTLTPLSTITANAGTGTFTVDGSGHTQPVSGTFWQATQPVSGTVTANIGTTGGLALDASVTALQVSQGSSTSGEKGSLILGAVTTAAPSYTTAQSSPLSLTTAGALRIDGSGATQPVSGTFWQSTQPVSIATLPALTTGSAVIGRVSIDQTTPGTTNLVALAANQSVNVAQINATTPLMGNGTTGTGSQRVTIASDNTAFSVNAIPKTPTAVTVKQAAVTVGTSAVRLTNDGSAPPATRVLLMAQLLSSSTANCFMGSATVTSSSTTRGVQMFAGQTYTFNNDAGDYYAICDASSQTFLITEQE